MPQSASAAGGSCSRFCLVVRRLASRSQLRVKQLADLGEVTGDALLLLGQLAELALGCGLNPLDLVLGVGQELVRPRP